MLAVSTWQWSSWVEGPWPRRLSPSVRVPAVSPHHLLFCSPNIPPISSVKIMLMQRSANQHTVFGGQQLPRRCFWFSTPLSCTYSIFTLQDLCINLHHTSKRVYLKISCKGSDAGLLNTTPPSPTSHPLHIHTIKPPSLWTPLKASFFARLWLFPIHQWEGQSWSSYCCCAVLSLLLTLTPGCLL